MKHRQMPRVKIGGLIDTYEVGSLTLRAAYQYATLPGATEQGPTFRTLSNVFGMLGAPDAAATAANIANVMEEGFIVRFMAVSMSYDPGDWFVLSELWKQNGSTLIPKHTSGYVSGGIRIGAWTPYATISTTRMKKLDGIIALESLPQIPALLDGVRQINDSFGLAAPGKQTSFSIGARWDVYRNVAIKAQYDYIALPSDSGGLFRNRSDSFQPGKDASLFGLSVDFVF